MKTGAEQIIIDIANEAKVRLDTAQQSADEAPAAEATAAQAKRAPKKQLAVAEPEVEATE